MQAIEVKFLPVTNHLPARVKAFCEAGELTISMPCEMDYQQAAKHCADLLLQKLGWKYGNYSDIAMGQLKSGNYAFVFIPKEYEKQYPALSLHELIDLYKENNQPGYYFDRSSMKFFGDTLSNFKVKKGIVRIDTYTRKNIPCYELQRKKPVKHGLRNSAYFCADTFERILPAQEV